MSNNGIFNGDFDIVKNRSENIVMTFFYGKNQTGSYFYRKEQVKFYEHA